MIKLGILIIITTFQLSQASITQDSTGIEELLREQHVENQLLEQEVEILEEHVKEIRNTVYWALGGVFTLALLFVGVNWFSINKLYEKDKERLKETILAELKRKEVNLNSQILTSRKELEKEINDQILNLDDFKLNILSLLGEHFHKSEDPVMSISLFCSAIIEFNDSDMVKHEQMELILNFLYEELIRAENIEDEFDTEILSFLEEELKLIKESGAYSQAVQKILDIIE